MLSFTAHEGKQHLRHGQLHSLLQWTSAYLKPTHPKPKAMPGAGSEWSGWVGGGGDFILPCFLQGEIKGQFNS